jgi:hypothetical protein
LAGRRPNEEELKMGLYLTRDDFEAIGRQFGANELAADDAWMDFATFDGSAREFYAARKVSHPHRFTSFAPADESAEHACLFSLAEQGKFLREHGQPALEELLRSQSLRLGQVKPKPVAEFTESTNPYSDQCKLSPEAKEKAISLLIRTQPTKAASLSRSVGRTIDGKPLRPVGAAARAQR